MTYISDRGIDLKEIKERERSVNYIISSQNLLLPVYMRLDVHVIPEQSLPEILKNPIHINASSKHLCLSLTPLPNNIHFEKFLFLLVYLHSILN